MTDERPPCRLASPGPGIASGGCTSGQPAAYRIRYTFMRADMSGVDTKTFDVCADCYADKAREADAEGAAITIVAAYT